MRKNRQRNIDAAYERIIAWADRDPETGCLVSRYSVGSHGYAQAWDGVTVVLAHRIVWEFNNGPIPPGMTVDHGGACFNRRCEEIAHMRLLPNLENARRTNGRDWPLGTCINGHGPEFWKPKGPERMKGYCSECRRIARVLT